MNKNLIEGHLKFLETFSNEKPTVFVYKGFPVTFLIELNQRIPHINELGFVDKSHRIDLERIKSDFISTLLHISKIKHNKTFLIYEEFLLIPSEHLNQFGVNFKIITNNFYEFFPNQTTLILPDIEESINTDTPIEDNELFNLFYSESREFAGFNCIQYLNYNYDTKSTDIERLNFFDASTVSLPYFEDNSANAKNLIQFKAADNSYFNLKYGLFKNIFPSSLNLLVDENIWNITKDLNELNILYYILSENKCEINFFQKIKRYEDYWRPELDHLLKKYWYEKAQFKKLKIYSEPATSKELLELSQGSVAEHIIQQVELAQKGLLFEDIFLTAPTGAGKSLLFQLPAIYIAENLHFKAVTIVISPLKALMSDQVTALKNNRNYSKVAFLNSDLTLIERNNILEQTIRGDITILYLSPELLLSYDIKSFIGEREIGLLIIDEAHLVTTWGRDFRVDYWFLGNYIRKLRRSTQQNSRKNNQLKSYRFPVVALTATAVYTGADDMVFETIQSLNMLHCKIFIGSIKREEISFEYNKFATKNHQLDKIVKTKQRIKEFVESGKKSIFYFPWTNQIDEIKQNIDRTIEPLVRSYHSNLDVAERSDSLSLFKTGKAKTVLATKAFGMGVDISDIEIVYHHAPSGSLADYVQEIGRVARIPGMNGIAMTDFNPKDLIFTKILFGLSSLKQYQVDLVLKKLNNLYQIRKNRNMLVSIEDFRYIFTKDEDDDKAEQKIKSALLVIEKDLLAKFENNVIIVRPKRLFSVVYGSVSKSELEILKQNYGNFIKVVHATNYQSDRLKLNDGSVAIRGRNDNKKYIEISLDKIWESHFPNHSFPATKFKFYSNELFPSVEPVLMLQIYFNEPINDVKVKLEGAINVLEDALDSFNGESFKKDNLIKELKIKLQNETKCRKIADLLTVLFADERSSGNYGHNTISNGNFLQTISFKNETKYRYFGNSFTKVKSQMLRLYQYLFDGIGDSAKEYIGFIPAKANDAREKIKLVYLLEIFELSTYKISGGKLPQLFIRINDPQKINVLSRKKYTNDVVTNVERRHKLSVEIMSYFFQNNMSDKERWEYIEDYFLGYEVVTSDVLPPVDKNIFFDQGKEKYQKKDYKGAIEDYTKAIEIDPKFSEAFNYRGASKNNLADHNGAIEDYTNALEIDPNNAYAYYNRGNSKKDLKDYDAAIADYTNAINIDPDFAFAFHNRGILRQWLDDYDSAIADLDRAIEIDPKWVLAYFNRAEAKSEINDHFGAISDYRKAIEIDPIFSKAKISLELALKILKDSNDANTTSTKATQIETLDASSYYTQGNKKAELKDYQGAIADFSKAIEINPDFFLAYCSRGYAKNELQYYHEAIEDFNVSIKLNPNYAEAYNGRGIAKLELKCYFLANNDFSTAIKIDPMISKYLFNRGVARINLKRYKTAINDLTKALKIYPNDPATYFTRGFAKDEIMDYNGALYDYSKAIEIDPNYSKAINKRKLIIRKIKDSNIAKTASTEATQIETHEAETYYSRGNEKIELKDYQGAIADFTKAIEINPNYFRAYCSRGYAKNELQYYHEAIEDFNKSIKINPKYIDSYNGRGVAKLELKWYLNAIDDFTIALSIDPTNSMILYNRGLAKNSLKRFKSAITDLTKALKNNPNDADIYFTRGFAKDETEDYNGALNDYNKAIEIDPGYAKAYFNRGLIKRILGDNDGADIDEKKYGDLTK